MKKTVWILFALLLALLPTSALLAQDAPPVLCGELDAEDCAILEEAALADSEVTEASYAFEIELEISDVPDMPFEMLAFNWAQEASYVSDPDLSDDMMAYLEELDPEAMADVDLLADIVGMIVEGIDTEQSFVISLSDETADLLSSQMGMAIPSQIGLTYALIDGIIYVNVSDLAAFIPELAGMPFQGWVGTELAPILDIVFAQIAADPEAAASMGSVGAILGGSVAGTEMVEQQIAMFEQFVEVTRLEDDEIDGEPVAVFETVFDFIAFASSPEFMDYVEQQFAMSEMMGMETPSQEELDEMAAAMPELAPILFDGLDYDIVQSIGLESGFTLAAEASMEWDFASLAAMADMGDAEPYFGFFMETMTTDQGEIGAIEPPQGAFVVPAQMLLSMMGG